MLMPALCCWMRASAFQPEPGDRAHHRPQAQALCAEQSRPCRPGCDRGVDPLLPRRRCRLRGHQRQAEGRANAVKVAIEKELSGLLERRQNRGMGGAKTQVMLCGIPNVGKSTFINTFAGSARAKAADRPGVTKGKQWVSTEKFDLLDMPACCGKSSIPRPLPPICLHRLHQGRYSGCGRTGHEPAGRGAPQLSRPCGTALQAGCRNTGTSAL